MIMMEKFIKTQDEETANQLKQSGFLFVQKENNYYVFANNSSVNFADNINQTKINYSNKICI